jgi:single-stranded DNA-binding protein
MSFDVLIQGKLRGGVAFKQSSNSHPYASFKLTTTDKKGAGLLASVIVFSESAIDTVRSLDDGDTVAVSGEAAISTWTGGDGSPRYGLDVTAHLIITAYHAGRKRRTPDLSI